MEVRQTLGGRYKLLDELGRGGMAVVWRARDEVLGRTVAVKLLAARFAGDPQSRARIRDEARAAATLSHPNIAQVYDYGEAVEDGVPVPYVVMELVNGPTLQQRVTAGPLPPRTVFRICGEVAAALAAAHLDGLVHRDIKMANIMVTGGGAKVVDFGIAAAAGPAAPEEMLVGTPAYLAPERLTGAAIVPASDVYALGVLLYRLLSSESPWSVETTTQMLRAHIYVEPAPLPPLAGVSPAVADLISRCLQKDPAARPSAGEVSAALADAAEAADPVRDEAALPLPAEGRAGDLHADTSEWSPLDGPPRSARAGRKSAAAGGAAAAAGAGSVGGGAGAAAAGAGSVGGGAGAAAAGAGGVGGGDGAADPASVAGTAVGASGQGAAPGGRSAVEGDGPAGGGKRGVNTGPGVEPGGPERNAGPGRGAGPGSRADRVGSNRRGSGVVETLPGMLLETPERHERVPAGGARRVRKNERADPPPQRGLGAVPPRGSRRHPGDLKRKAVLAGAAVAVVAAALAGWFLAGSAEQASPNGSGPEGITSAAPATGGVLPQSPVVTGPAGPVLPGATGGPGLPPAGSGPAAVPVSPGGPAQASTSAEGGTPRSSAAPTASAAPQGKKLTSKGGSVYASCAGGKAKLNSWDPAPGYSVEKVNQGPALAAVIVFKGPSDKLRMTVTCVAGTPTPVVLPL